jgi:orotidine-5'-phosphate decarboxylase
MNQQDLEEVGVSSSPLEQVMRLAKLCHEQEFDGVVCSSMEATALRNEYPDSFCLVTPGIRPAGSSSGDQKRIVTPADAIRNGSSYLVVGRPITRAEEPLVALEKINSEISGII